MDQKSPEAFRTISEVAEWLGVPTHVLRFWESRFSQVKPVKRAGGRRYYRPADMELLGGIRQLLHEDGMTIRGVQKLLREQGVKHVAGMSPPLDLGAETEDVTPSNVVDLSERRGEETEEAQDEAWETESEAEADADEPEPEPADAVEAPEFEPESEPEPDWADTTGTEPVEEPDSFWQDSDQDDDTAAPDDGNIFDNPDQVAFHAHDAEPDAFEGADTEHTPPPADFTPPEPDPEPVSGSIDQADPMGSPEAPGFAAHEADPETVGAEPESPVVPEPAWPGPETDGPEPASSPAPLVQPAALAMPDIGPDPDDGAAAPDRPSVAASLRAARAAEADLPVENLWALADRLGELASRMGTGSGLGG